jgi:hypothetical protein
VASASPRSRSRGDNIAFGLVERGGFAKSAIRKRVSDLLELVSLPGVEERFPAQLSGGQMRPAEARPGQGRRGDALQISAVADRARCESLRQRVGELRRWGLRQGASGRGAGEGCDDERDRPHGHGECRP